MVGLVLVSHAPLGAALIRCVDHIFGHLPERILAIDVQGTEVKETLFAHIHRAVQRVDGGSGVLILTDLYGATPSNVTHDVFEQAMNLRFNPTTPSADGQVTELAIVAGMSLPMVLRAIGNRALPLPQLVEKVCDGGHQAILYRLPHTTAPQHQHAQHE